MVESYLVFVAASAGLTLLPGPNVTLLVASSVTNGPRRALVTLAGTSTAIALQLAVVAAGMTSLIPLLAESFSWLRWVGAAYLLWLGIQHWRAAPVALDEAEARGRQTLFWQGVLVSGTNSKTLMFHAAFLPQFIDPNGPVGPQMALLCATFLVIAMVLDACYVLLAGRLRGWLRDRRRAQLRNRLTGSLLIATGLGLALARRS